MMEFTSTKPVLTLSKLQEIVPSVFTTEKKSSLTDKYNFVPTFEVVKTLAEKGWLPVKAEEMKCRNEQGIGFQKHLLRFRCFDEGVSKHLRVGDVFIEIVLSNSHNGLSSFIFNCGLFRLACLNGMVTSEAAFNSIHIRHNSYEAQKVLDVCSTVADRAPLMGLKVTEMKQIILNPEEKNAFAEAAKVLRFDDPASVNNQNILQPRRYEDKKDDLWTTFNVVQENLVKGNIRQITHDAISGRPKMRHTREVKSIDGNMKLNQALWTLGERLKEIKLQGQVKEETA